jgi:hypothetical protein
MWSAIGPPDVLLARKEIQKLRVYSKANELGDVVRLIIDNFPSLPFRQEMVLDLRFAVGATLQQIADVLHVTKERIRQIEFRALWCVFKDIETHKREKLIGFIRGLLKQRKWCKIGDEIVLRCIEGHTALQLPAEETEKWYRLKMTHRQMRNRLEKIG